MSMTEAEEKTLREQAYNDELEPEPPKADPPEPDQGSDPEPEPDTTGEQEDPWAGVPPALRDQIKSISERVEAIDTIDYRLKQTERRLGGIQNEFYAAQKAAKEQKNAPTPEELEKASKSQKAWDEMKEDFPEIAEAIEARLADTKPDLDAIREEMREELKQGGAANEDLERRLLGIAHRDWQDVVRSADYQAWLKKQSQVVQEKAMYGKTADEAIDVLDRYKAGKKKPPEKKSNDRLARAVDAPRGPARRPPKSEADLSEAELRQQIASEVWSE